MVLSRAEEACSRSCRNSRVGRKRPLTTRSRVWQVSEMAEDGSEEIMFICKWPVPVPQRRRRDARSLGGATSTFCVCVREELFLCKLK